MALFKKLISAVKKFLGGRPSSRRAKRKITPRRRINRLKKKIKPVKKKRTAAKKVQKTKRAVSQRPAKFLKSKKFRPALGVKLSQQPEQSKGILTGEVTHYFSKISVVVVKMTHGNLAVGNQVQVHGKSTNFAQKITSLQIESQDVKVAPKGQLGGLKVIKPAKPGDKVFKLPS